jgi:hypothetical protein
MESLRVQPIYNAKYVSKLICILVFPVVLVHVNCVSGGGGLSYYRTCENLHRGSHRYRLQHGQRGSRRNRNLGKEELGNLKKEECLDIQ